MSLYTGPTQFGLSSNYKYSRGQLLSLLCARSKLSLASAERSFILSISHLLLIQNQSISSLILLSFSLRSAEESSSSLLYLQSGMSSPDENHQLSSAFCLKESSRDFNLNYCSVSSFSFCEISSYEGCLKSYFSFSAISLHCLSILSSSLSLIR